MTTKNVFLCALATLVAGSVAVLLTGCGANAAPQQPAPPTVTVAQVEQKDLVEWDEFTGRTEAVESVDEPVDLAVKDRDERWEHHRVVTGIDAGE